MEPISTSLMLTFIIRGMSCRTSNLASIPFSCVSCDCSGDSILINSNSCHELLSSVKKSTTPSLSTKPIFRNQLVSVMKHSSGSFSKTRSKSSFDIDEWFSRAKWLDDIEFNSFLSLDFSIHISKIFFHVSRPGENFDRKFPKLASFRRTLLAKTSSWTGATLYGLPLFGTFFVDFVDLNFESCSFFVSFGEDEISRSGGWCLRSVSLLFTISNWCLLICALG